MRRLLPLILVAAAVAIIALLAGVGRPEAARGEVATARHRHDGRPRRRHRRARRGNGHRRACTRRPPSASGALAENAKLMNAVIAALKAAGGDDLQTQQVSLVPADERAGGRDRLRSRQLRLREDEDRVRRRARRRRGRKPARTPSAAPRCRCRTATLATATRSRRRSTTRALKAQALAQAGGFGVGPVSSVTESAPEGGPIVFAALDGKRAASTPIEPGTQDVTADVTVTFRIR